MFLCQHSSLHLPTALRSPTFCSLHVPTVPACCRNKMSNWEKCSRKQESFDRWCTAQFIHGAKAALTCQLFAFFNFKKLVKNGLQNSLISFCNCKFICKCLNVGNLSSSASSLHSSLISLSMQMQYLKHFYPSLMIGHHMPMSSPCLVFSSDVFAGRSVTFASGALLAWILGHLSEQLGKLLFCLDLPLLVNLFHTPFNRMLVQTHDTCVSPMWFPVDRSPCHLSVGASSAGHPPFDPCQCATVQYTDWDGTIRKNTRPSTHR